MISRAETSRVAPTTTPVRGGQTTAAPAPKQAKDALALTSPAAQAARQYAAIERAAAPSLPEFQLDIRQVRAAKGDAAALYVRTAQQVLPTIPTSVDDALGQAQLQSFRAQNKALPDDDPRTRRAQAMVDRLAGPNASFPYHVTVFEADGMEAASVGGRTIIMTTGMLDELDTDDKLAGVLGHELTHAERRDVVAANLYDAFATKDGPTAKGVVQALCRAQESRADAEGARRAAAAGYAPDGMARWLLSEKTPAERRAQEREARRHPDAQDHPTDAQRIADLQALIARERL